MRPADLAWSVFAGLAKATGLPEARCGAELKLASRGSRRHAIGYNFNKTAAQIKRCSTLHDSHL
jgi:hypothetical protein